MEYHYNWKWFNKKEEILTLATTQMNPEKHQAKWNSPITKDHMLYESVYTKCSEKGNLDRLMVPRASKEEEEEQWLVGDKHPQSKTDCGTDWITLFLWLHQQ